MSDKQCSRAGCRSVAVWRIDWRNPRIHGPERRKSWIACDEHVAFLRDYLATRGFPVEVLGLADLASEGTGENV